MRHYFVMGYGQGEAFVNAHIAPAPEDSAERGRAYDAILYSEAAQNGGMLVFSVEVPDATSARDKGQEAYGAWLTEQG